MYVWQIIRPCVYYDHSKNIAQESGRQIYERRRETGGSHSCDTLTHTQSYCSLLGSIVHFHTIVLGVLEP